MSQRRNVPRHRPPPRRPGGSGVGATRPSTPAKDEQGRPPASGSWLWLRPPPRALSTAGWALLPLRLFLGATFTFAGLQKLANPAFFRASDPNSIQAQLAGAARRSPVHALVSPLVHVAVPLGIVIALAETAIGIGTLIGLWSRVAAAGGAVLAFSLFLTVSFHAKPYYTGADIVFVFAWLPLVLAGSGGVLSVDGALAAFVRHRDGAPPDTIVPIPFDTVRQVCGHFEDGRCTARRNAPCEPGPCPYLAGKAVAAERRQAGELDRRTFATKGALAGVVAAGSLLLGGAAAALGRLAGGTSTARTTGTLPGPGSAAPTTTTTGAGPTATTSPAATTTTAGATPAGTRIGPAKDVPVGGAAQFQDPTTGDPSLVVQPQAGTFLAFDAVCPHAGCIVEYDPNGHRFVCPCHGSQFNGRTGAVETGPAVTGLGRIRIAEGSDGQLYVT
ncbi:MAG: Rieske 2Fe-2S domain-containing protein [Acidimicrobiales bacterium]